MNVENEKIEPVTELGLALGCSRQCNKRRLNSDSGAGANAGSRVDLKFVATDPLSELVWSPRNGPSLKCADSSFVDKKNSLLWSAGSSSVVLSPMPSITAGRCSTDKPINEEKFMTPQDAFHWRNGTADRYTSGWTGGRNVAVMPDSGLSHEDRRGTGCYVQETNSVIGISLQHIKGKEEIRCGKGECMAGPNNNQMAEISEANEKIFSGLPAGLGPDLAQNEPLSGDPIAGGKDVRSGNQRSRIEIALASGFQLTKKCEANDTFQRNLTSLGKRRKESASFLEKESQKNLTLTNSLTLHPLEKLESTSENDLQTLFGKNVHGAASRIVASESGHEVKHSSQQDEETVPKEKTISDEHSPTKSKIQRYRGKGKEKALSDGDVNGRMSKEDNDSHESVESCNSAGLFSTGKKRWNFEQQLIVGSKKVRRQIQESPGSTSFIKQDSSFMNWISNMTKGFSKSNIVDAPAPSLALTLAHPTHEHEIPDQQLIMYNNINQESGCRNVGFQSIFRSLYCPKTQGLERAVDDDYQTELQGIDGQCNIRATPLAYCSDNDNMCKQLQASNEKFNESELVEGAGMATQPKISSANFASGQVNSNSAENKNSCNLGTHKGERGTDSNFSMGKCKMSRTENIDSEPQFKVKTNYNFVHESDPLGSLWITRFAPKTSFSLLNFDNQNHSSSGPLDCSTSCQKNIPCSWNPISSSNLKIVEAGPHVSDDPPVVVGKELQNCAAEAEISTGFKGIEGHNDQKSICKLNLITPSSRLKNSEAMVSNFAKRLDALKYIMHSDVTDNAACATISCFFCGKKGHHLRDCSELTGGELEDLMKNINSHNVAEELPSLHIRGFQLKNWATACPSASSRGENQLETNDFSPNEMQLHRRNEQSTKLLDGKCLAHAAGTHTACDQDDPQKDTALEINHKLNQGATFDRMICNANLVKDYFASGSGEKKLIENQTMPSSNFFLRHISEVPKGTLDFIKRLRLSRMDILKWMNSHISLAHLNGFFLRLRLGKWEEGLGGTRYFVACITGAQRENPPQNSKSSISVNVGGMKCLVESQYISNHDFLEDELMAWWSATVKSGVNIPSEEDLGVKIEERKMLGM